MFWILKYIPDWFSWALLIAGLSGYFLTRLAPRTPYTLLLKIVSAMLVGVTIFIFGVQYSNHAWTAAGQELQQKVLVAEQQSTAVNTQVEQKLVFKTQIVRERGADVVQYIDREVVKWDTTCVIPPEFVSAHNQAAKP